MDRSPGFGSAPCDFNRSCDRTPYSDSVSLRLPYSVNLATECKSLTHYTKGTQSHRQPENGQCSHCLYAQGFRVYFTPLNGVLFAFPSRYWFTIGQSGVFSLGGWSPHVQTGFHVSRPTRYHHAQAFVYGAFTHYGCPFQSIPLTCAQLQGLLRFRSPLLTESRLISFPPGTSMFRFPGFAFPCLCIQLGNTR